MGHEPVMPPATCGLRPVHGARVPGGSVGVRKKPEKFAKIRPEDHAVRNLERASLCGLPQVTLPRATLEGCPLGLSLIGPRGSDLLLLQVARRLA